MFFRNPSRGTVPFGRPPFFREERSNEDVSSMDAGFFRHCGLGGERMRVPRGPHAAGPDAGRPKADGRLARPERGQCGRQLPLSEP